MANLIIAILCGLGLIGFYTDLNFFLHIGFILASLELGLGIITGSLRGLVIFVLAFMLALLWSTFSDTYGLFICFEVLICLENCVNEAFEFFIYKKVAS